MKVTVRQSKIACFLALCAALVLTTACQLAGSRSSWPPSEPASATATPPTATATDVDRPTPTPAATRVATDGCGSATLTLDYVPLTTAKLAGWGWEFVVADVEGLAPAAFNTHDGKRPPGYGDKPTGSRPDSQTMIYTPVDVTVDEAISGPSRPGPSQFLVAGGTADCVVINVYPSPSVEVGSRYVFILADVFDNTGENELSLQEAKFAWPVDDKGIVSTVDGPMSIDELTEIVSETPPSPVPPHLASPAP